MSEELNLTEICGIGDDDERHSPRRVASMWLENDRRSLLILEGCDEYFAVRLTPTEVDRLIAHLVDLRSQMVEP